MMWSMRLQRKWGLLPHAILVAVIALSCASALARSRNHKGKGKPGVFDYYVLSLSWSPEYCAEPAGKNDNVQCGQGRRYGFVVHGLWPQYEKGFPESCAPHSTVSSAIVDRTLPLMPSSKLIQHEWDKHGTCSGLDTAAYFDLIRSVREGVKIPDDYTAPIKQVTARRTDIKEKFVAANAGYALDSLHLLCSGRFLSEVRVCFSKDMKPRACSADVRDACSTDPVILRPLR